MKDLSPLVSSLKQKAERLVEKHVSFIQENDKFSKEIIELKLKLKEKDLQLSELNDKIKLLKITGSVDNENTKDVKLKINEMVREIDKCIAQISR